MRSNTFSRFTTDIPTDEEGAYLWYYKYAIACNKTPEEAHAYATAQVEALKNVALC